LGILYNYISSKRGAGLNRKTLTLHVPVVEMGQIHDAKTTRHCNPKAAEKVMNCCQNAVAKL
jgi:hypothetical protein